MSRWISGAERVQVDALYPVPCLYSPFVYALANGAADITRTVVLTREVRV